ncbi:protein of unknown function (DUF543), putative [Trypanosoma equiperdum]|uniref:Uncharacterized protein n=4 Tax=Trypanozoon TaxID=39700 RepID=Q386U0_TRYB2|nr:hypothetical protein, conserved [Trypanosoma brucei gambiense DAL972]XP_828303.1 hypothetical protein, conserved [Trypanosoma brucei brucei TREU927]RHW68489.1 hypothetical protein DPX39_110028100 [Trypanosoma brucei equiperdum]SCU72916.1 Domain of unknown function (DUF543), putative [Trypanosoma equiperdum]EAN79191.1 hypothetical protein, conserved [Trypanosoma brucei brucei TREU927]CBH17122.1 hypothetical protein, conserved [Trypanosoma brucei gambiense DAL972]|eukprot:XP_011779386.1 hypothetical protein, conserved [Trypanosoma brucei gambiense DAL972]
MSEQRVSQPKTPVSNEEKWDHSLENFFRKTTLGLAYSILPAFLLARSAAARGAILMFATGIGSGIAYGEARYLFDHDVVFDRRHLVHIELLKPKESKIN